MNSKDCEKWKISVKEELDNLDRNKVGTLVKRQKGMKVIKSKWIFKTKLNEKGEVVRHKASLVALGNQPRPGIDFDLTYSPVVKMKSS